MQQITAGEMLYRFRMEKGVSMRQLGKGLCSPTTIFNYESNARWMDTLLFAHFLERMGISSENFALMLNDDEYEYFKWKESCYVFVEKKQWTELEEFLKKEVAIKPVGNVKVQDQFYYYMCAILCGEKYEHYEKAIDYLQKAAKQSIPDIRRFYEDGIALSSKELHIILLFLYYGLRGNLIDQEDANLLFRKLDGYCQYRYLEKGERTKIHAKVVCTWLNYGSEYLDTEKKIQLCKNAIALSRKEMQFFDILEILRIYIALLEQVNDPEVTFYRKQQAAFAEIFAYAEVDGSFRPEIIGARSPKIYLIKEYLLYKRKDKNLTQEKASEGICEPETYSRVETGQRPPSPTNLYALAERLDIGWHYYRGELDTDNKKVYQLRKKQRTALIKNNLQECLETLKEMELLLDMDSVPNLQYIRSKEYMTKKRMGLMSYEELYQRDTELLQMTVKLDSRRDKVVYYSQTEQEIIGNMGLMLRQMGKTKEGIELLEIVLAQMSQSKVSFSFQWNGISLILRVLSGLYFEGREYQKAYDIMYYVYKETVKFRNGGNLPEMLDSMSDSLEHIGIQHSEEYKMLCRLAVYAADFYGNQYAKEILQKYYDDNLEKEYVWY